LLWSRLKSKIPEFFKGVDVKPSLLHGDLWSGNVAEIQGGPGNLTISNNDHSLFFPNRQG